MRLNLTAACAAGALFLAAAGPAAAQEAEQYFKQNCSSCHTVGGGKLVGPDLKDVTQRRDRGWLVRFISDPKGMIDGGDAAAQQALQEYRGVLMPVAPGMNAARAESMLKLIEAESKLPKSQFSAVAGKLPDRPFTEAEIGSGRDLFLGRRPLANGGPSCISCHSANGVGALGGGRLGPDLSTVYARLEGRNGLAGWLSSPPSPTMVPVYKAHPLTTGEGASLGEVALLVAYLEQTNRQPAQPGMVDRMNFLLLGLAGAAGGFILMDFLWRRRFRSVLGPLTGGGSA